jgi:hypothetical protein
MDDESVGLGMIGAGTGRVRSEVVDSRSKGKSPAHFCLTHIMLTSQPNYHEPTNSVLKCLESHNPQNQVLPPHSRSHLYRVLKLLHPLWQLLRMIKSRQRMIGGLLVVCLRMSRRMEVVYLVRSSVLGLYTYMYDHTSCTVYRVAGDRR